MYMKKILTNREAFASVCWIGGLFTSGIPIEIIAPDSLKKTKTAEQTVTKLDQNC